MYEAHFGLRERAFRKTPDPRYLYLNGTYEEALAQLLYAVQEMELALLTGEVGAGKTLLTRALIDRLGDGYEIAMILNPRLPPRQFLRALAVELGVTAPRFQAGELLEQIQDRLLVLDEQRRPALLIVDEAHLVPGKSTFEEIRLLTNFQLDDRNLIAVMLVGQPELRARLRRPAYRALTQRIGAQFHLPPLSEPETLAYVRHRLAVAGAADEIFTEAALRTLHRASWGIPRVLNHLATQSLLEALGRGARRVDEEMVRAAAQDQLCAEDVRTSRGAPVRPDAGPLPLPPPRGARKPGARKPGASH